MTDEILHYKYCPSCHDEFRADVEFCAECGVALVFLDDLQVEEEPVPAFPSLADLALLRVGDGNWIRELALKLRALGISFRIESTDELAQRGELDPSAFTVRDPYAIFVRSDELAAAQAVDRQHYREEVESVLEVENDEDEVEMRTDDDACPACGGLLPTHCEECPECGLFLGA